MTDNTIIKQLKLEEGESKPFKNGLLGRMNKLLFGVVIGLFVVVIFVGCSIYEELFDVEDCCVWLDDVYLTEQEAVDLIRYQLEEAGLIFDKASHPHIVHEDNTAQLVLVNEELDLNIALVGHWHLEWSQRHRWYELNSDEARFEFTENAKRQFEDEFGISVDVIFFNPLSEIAFGSGESFEVQNERIEVYRVALEEGLTHQVQDFISQLRDEDVID